MRLCQGHTSSVLLPTKDLCGGDLVQEAGDSFAINMAQGHPQSFAKPSSGCTGISNASTKAPLLLLSLGSHLCHQLLTLPAGSSSLPISFHTHICLSSPWVFRPLLAESITKCYMTRRSSGGSRNKAEWLMSLWRCLSNLYLQMHVGIWNGVYVLAGGPWGVPSECLDIDTDTQVLY